VTFLPPFSVEDDRFWSPKGEEKLTHSVKKGDLLIDKMVTKMSPKSMTKLSSPFCHNFVTIFGGTFKF
jgi:hypothetical protein